MLLVPEKLLVKLIAYYQPSVSYVPSWSLHLLSLYISQSFCHSQFLPGSLTIYLGRWRLPVMSDQFNLSWVRSLSHQELSNHHLWFSKITITFKLPFYWNKSKLGSKESFTYSSSESNPTVLLFYLVSSKDGNFSTSTSD